MTRYPRITESEARKLVQSALAKGTAKLPVSPTTYADVLRERNRDATRRWRAKEKIRA